MSEHQDQVDLMNWAKTLETQIPELEMLYAIPNGGKRHKAVAAKLKAEGVKAGVFDLSLDVARGEYHGLRIEMKHGRNALSDNQKVWSVRYTKHGYAWLVCYGWVDAAMGVLTYLKEPFEGRI